MSSASQASPDSQRRVVLVADDEEAILNLSERVITGLGLVALRVNDGEAAIEFVSRCRRLLLCAILDIQMPILSGADAAHAIQQIAPDLTIVLMGGRIPDSLADRVSQLRPFTQLAKPLSVVALRNTLVQIVEASAPSALAWEQPPLWQPGAAQPSSSIGLPPAGRVTV